MKYLFFILIILFILAILSMFLKIKVIISYEYGGKDDDFSIQLTMLGFIKYKIHIPKLENDNKSPSAIYKVEEEGNEEDKAVTDRNSLQHFIQVIGDLNLYFIHMIGYHTIVRKFLKKVSIHDFHWRTMFGAGDAALTGSFSGILWGIKGNVVGMIVTYFLVKKPPKITIEPKFDQFTLNTSFICILSFRIGHAILAGIKMIRHLKKEKLIFSRKAEQTVGRNMNV